MEQEDYYLQDYLENVEKYRTLSGLKTYFETRYQKSLDKDTFLKREIEGYELVFDESKLPLSIEIEDWDCQPLFNYSIRLYEWEIISIRRAYLHFIIQGNDISDAENWIKSLSSFLPPKFTDATYFIDLAKELKKYITWVKEYSVSKLKYPDKYYAWYHKILIALGKAEQFTRGVRNEISDYGKIKYGTKSGFYQAFIEFDLTRRQSFVNGLSQKDRKKWKRIISEISNNDSDVINYLKNFPN